MPPAYYVLSYEETGSILTYCQLEKQDLSKSGAVDALLDQLVDDQLVLSLALATSSTSKVPPIKIKKAQLKLDEVKVDDDQVLAEFLVRPYRFVLDLPSPTSAGNGTVKTLVETPTAPAYNLYSSNPPVATPANPTNTFRVTFSPQAPTNITMHAIIDGVPQPAFTVPVSPVMPDIDFKLNTALAKNSWHTVFFAGAGIQPFFGVLPAQ